MPVTLPARPLHYVRVTPRSPTTRCRVKGIRFSSILFVALTAGCDIFNVVDQSPQTWTLLNSAGQMATVVVSPFTNSGTFGETSNSAGWWVDITQDCSIRLTVGGNITKTSSGDHWTFVSLGGAGCGHQSLGTAEGTANGNFPNANQVANGTLSISTEGPGGDATGTGTWNAVRIN